MKTHYLKIKQKYANLHMKGLKDWELRKNDKDFKKGDFIDFQIITKNNTTIGFYEREILNVFQGGKYGLDKDYCILSIKNEI